MTSTTSCHRLNDAIFHLRDSSEGRENERKRKRREKTGGEETAVSTEFGAEEAYETDLVPVSDNHRICRSKICAESELRQAKHGRVESRKTKKK